MSSLLQQTSRKYMEPVGLKMSLEDKTKGSWGFVFPSDRVFPFFERWSSVYRKKCILSHEHRM